jgi:predicted ATP-grasp superfamily ATP-dependent carboligase
MIGPMQAIILDGELKSALSAVRSLGSKNIQVSVGAMRDTAMSLHSRFAQHRFLYPSPYADERGFITAVEREADRLGGKPVVFAMSDVTHLSLYRHRKQLKDRITLVFPEDDSMEIAFNKAATFSFARVHGIPAITTYLPENREDIGRLSASFEFPLVVKPRRSVTWKNGASTFGSAVFIHSLHDLYTVFETLKTKLGEPPLIQPFIKGEEYGVEMLAHKGRIYARVAHHRLRSLSPTGGASVLKETLQDGELKRTLEEHAHTLVEALAWTGPLMVEFKVEEGSKQPYLMEINGRWWGSLPLSVSSGVDMPYLFFKATHGDASADIVTGREGVVTRHFWGDALHLLKVFFKHDLMRKLLYPQRSKAFRDFFSSPRGTKGDVWSLNDPKPAMMECIDIVARYYRQ